MLLLSRLFFRCRGGGSNNHVLYRLCRDSTEVMQRWVLWWWCRGAAGANVGDVAVVVVQR